MATDYLNIMENYVWINFIVIVWSFFKIDYSFISM